MSLVEEAVFFHAVARHAPTRFEIKGNNPLTEHYSVLRPEVLVDHDGERIADAGMRVVRSTEPIESWLGLP